MSQEVLDRHWKEILARENVLNVALGTKFKEGKDTGVTAIVVYVSKKVPAVALAPEHLIPETIEGIITDVVELAPATWQAGKTEISQLRPEEQLRRLGATKPPVPPHKALVSKPTFSQSSDTTRFASPVQDQQNCGECVSYGGIGTVEGKYRVQVNNPLDPIKLSEDDAFFCSGGTCNGGQDVATFLDWLVANYVCTEDCQPSKNQDTACGTGRCATPWVGAKKLVSWTAITDINQMKALLDNEPLIVVMAVHQSFFNYVSGRYQSLGPSDPVVGYHCIGMWGHDEPSTTWGPVRNSWGPGWGERGYFHIAFGDSEIDQQMWQVVVDLNPIPTPNPNPDPNPPTPGNGCLLKFWPFSKKK